MLILKRILVTLVFFLVSCQAKTMMEVASSPQDKDINQCKVDGKTYAHGMSVPSKDCNSCSCTNGNIACTEMGCAQPHPTSTPFLQCEQNAKTYAIGEAVPSLDGCNSCSCSEGGIACTMMACVEDPALNDKCKVETTKTTIAIKPLKSIAFHRDGGGDLHYTVERAGETFVLSVTKENFATSTRRLVITKTQPSYQHIKVLFDGGKSFEKITETKTGECQEPLTGTWSRWELVQDDDAVITNPSLTELDKIAELVKDAK